mmetsp:Transcript_89441/g.164054  ORF Transcript_89441/g.164054 Transcript_89441/m.164054 type:complete len:443 (+) Transcript_89441:132-1460(+)
MKENWSQAPFSPYAWNPVQVRCHRDQDYFVGTYVNSLSVDLDFADAKKLPLQLAPGISAAPGSPEPPCCKLIGSNLILCQGVALGRCFREPQFSESLRCRNLRLAKLPRGMRPDRSLQFAALMREASVVTSVGSPGVVTCKPHLVTLMVMPDGWILAMASHDAGLEGKRPLSAIDLSAVRFCIGGGLSLVDHVCLYQCEVAGTRLVVLQGMLAERRYQENSALISERPLALLPESCTPPNELYFVTAGARTGGFHLLLLSPTENYGAGCGVKISWKDAVWSRDQISLSGIIYEVAPTALEHSLFEFCWSWESSRIFIREFQGLIIRKCHSLEDAWREVFDTDGDGSINFTEFGLGCKAVGYVGNVMKLWAALDDDLSGSISLDELSQQCQVEGVASAVLREATPESTPRKGWSPAATARSATESSQLPPIQPSLLGRPLTVA